ncbi:unnamed protein product, partial [Staurois parvus]
MCPAVPPTCAHQCHPPKPIINAQQCCQSVPPISADYQYPSSVLPISAAYPCHLISAAYQSSSVLPISVHQCCLI